MTKRQELIEKFDRNKKLVFEFLNNYKNYLDSSGLWDNPALADANFSNKQYYDELVRVSDLEYSDKQTEAIRSIEIQEQFLDDYVKGVDVQFDNMSRLNNDILSKINT